MSETVITAIYLTKFKNYSN